MTKAKAAALAESNEEAVELRSRRFCGWQRNTQRLFFVGPSGERFRKKPEGLKRAAGKRRVSGLPEQGVKGNAVPFGRVKRRQSIIRVPGGNLRRGSRARPRPVKCWEPTLSTGYYLPTNIPVSVGSGGRGHT